jgi:hypothetical protein
VITNPKENHWIGLSGQKDDAIDALKLAQLVSCLNNNLNK